MIDYDLGDSAPNGLDIIEKLDISSKATLVTNRYDDTEIQKRCVSLGVKIIMILNHAIFFTLKEEIRLKWF